MDILSNIKISIKNFLELTRAYALGVTIASCIVIYAWANYSENFTFFNYFLLVFALCSLHLGANLFDDLIDLYLKVKQGIKLKDVHFNTFEEKAILIKNGTYSVKKCIIITAILFLIAFLAGLYFTYIAGYEVLYFMVLGVVLTLFYPIAAKYYVSELILGLIYGPLMIMGGYYAITAGFNSSLFTMSIAIFATTIILTHTHNIMDYEYDAKEEKNTLSIFMKDKKYSIFLLKCLIIMAYTIVVIGIIIGIFNPKMLIIFLTLPIAIRLIQSMNDYINIKNVEFQPKWYLGIFENWKEIKERKIDFYMYRLYLARNFILSFAILASIGAII